MTNARVKTAIIMAEMNVVLKDQSKSNEKIA